MKFTFDINKTIAAAGYALALSDGRMSVINLVKTLYYADRLALESWYRTITGDRFCSMDHGPVVSQTYDLICGKGSAKYQRTWNEFLCERKDNIVELRQMPENDILSQSEKECLNRAHAKVSSMSWKALNEWSHAFPEWKDPKGSSLPIRPEDILRLGTSLTQQEIQEIEAEADQANYVASNFELAAAR